LDNLCQEDLLCFLLKSFIFKLYVKEYDPFWINVFIYCDIEFLFYSLHVALAPFMKRIFFFIGTLVKNPLIINGRACLWLLSSLPLSYMHILMIVHHCLHCYRFVLNFVIKQY
jgi:hypothetical protein